MNYKKIEKESNANEENSNLFTSDISIMIKGKEYSELLFDCSCYIFNHMYLGCVFSGSR
jgi:hypothetical protein